jgi:hypothetical protein
LVHLLIPPQNGSTQPVTFLIFPRSGTNWLEWYVTHNTDINGIFTHFYEDQTPHNALEYPIVSSVRNPLDTVSSLLAMRNDRPELAHTYLQLYVNAYTLTTSKAEMLFTFEDITNNTEKAIKKVCDTFGANMTGNDNNYDNYKAWYQENKPEYKLITSKNEKRYQELRQYVSSLDLSNALELYNEALSKCIKV